jgi:hypothetical protein
MNGLYDMHQTIVELLPNPSKVTANDLIDRIKHLQGFFAPYIYHDDSNTNMQQDARLNWIMVIVDMEEDIPDQDSKYIDLVFTNTWGEIFTEVYGFKEGLSVIRDYIAYLDVKDTRELSSKVSLHVPQNDQGMALKKTIGEALSRRLAA